MDTQYPSIVDNIVKQATKIAERVGVTVTAVLWAWWETGTISNQEFVRANRHQ